ncbi:phage replisome organizer N-terminal domain-containing protein [Clostridium gasigenes]|uniref:phage replisome organizer N-terminal domain-containing protein n=1 Tax=Clostridium gasigenes TaxID=94869 RepID=UPI001C0AAB98|nr:phage replisome organizer N-terminal domain-containing protein [Clostridium gasigenes]MBU3131557.1 phage replisome organizer N-terminal domain-containing protein [Clostridium gasigenes]
MAKKYYWLKLKEDFFRQKEIKKLRKIAGGDTYTIIYLKIQLLSLKDNGKLFYEGVEDTFYEELALEIDEEPDNVQITVQYLMKYGLLEEVKLSEYVLSQTVSSIGSESTGAERQRKYAAKKKTLIDQQKGQIKIETSENDTQMICNDSSDTEKQTEQELELELELEIQQQLDKKITNILKEFSDEEIKSIVKYCKENIVPVDVVVEKWEIVKKMKSVRNRVGALIAAISNDWEKPKGYTGIPFIDGCSKRDYDYDAIEKRLLGWDNDEN